MLPARGQWEDATVTNGVDQFTAGGGGQAARAARPGRTRAVLAGLTLTAVVGGALAAVAASPAPGTAEPSPAAAAPADPVRPVPGRVVAGFAPPDQPYGPGRRGVRLAADSGEVVRAVRGGTVAFAGPVAGIPWVSVDHGGGLRTSYGPVEPQVRAGDAVVAGDALGVLAGEDGLHWGARVNDAYIDPLGLLRAWRPVLVSRDEQPE